MGIDITTRWRGQTQEEVEAQITGFDATAGKVGYLREAYHGGPYVTRYLLAEAFESQNHEAQIPSAVLRDRLPTAIVMALFRHYKVYKDKPDPANIDAEQLEKDGISIEEFIKKISSEAMEDDSHELIANLMPHVAVEKAEREIAERRLPDFALAFVDFVELCEEKEADTGEPVLIQVSC